MRFEIVTIFPDLVRGALEHGVVGRAIERGLLVVKVRDLRDFTHDRHRVVDDTPYGGGPGMVLKAEPMFEAVDTIIAESGRPSAVRLMSPRGRRFDQREARVLSGVDSIVLLCGRYEGVDERVRIGLGARELSIGDYVLTGGEWPALVVLDAVARLVPGVVGDEASVEHESFERGLLDFPQYTRPTELRGLKVPEVLLSGHHAKITRWRVRQAIERTADERPDLLEALGTDGLDDEEREILADVLRDRGARSRE